MKRCGKEDITNFPMKNELPFSYLVKFLGKYEFAIYGFKSSESKILPLKLKSKFSIPVDIKMLCKKPPTTFFILSSSALFLVINSITGSLSILRKAIKRENIDV